MAATHPHQGRSGESFIEADKQQFGYILRQTTPVNPDDPDIMRIIARLAFVAATILPAAAMQPAAAQGLFSQGITLEAGGIVVTAPKYEGSKSYQVMGAPIVFPSSMGPLTTAESNLQFKGLDDLRFRLLNQGGFEAGPLAGYRFGRDESDDKRLRGLADVDGGLVLGGYLGYRIGTIFPFVSYHHQVTGDDTGAIVKLGLESKTLVSSAMLITATIGTTWASNDYMDKFFSVTPFQSTRSGLASFDAQAGFKDVYFSVSSDIALDQRWTLKLLGRYSHLIGDASDSPITETQSQFFAGLGLTYKFNLGN